LGNIVIALGAVTVAVKVKKILQHSGIKADLVRASSRAENSGCTYGIKISFPYFYDVIDIMKTHGISYSVLSEL